MTKAAPAAPIGDACRRTEPRVPINRPSTVRSDDATPRDVLVENLSCDGFSFSHNMPLEPGAIVSIGLSGAGRTLARVTWRDGNLHGCAFVQPLSDAQLEAAFGTDDGRVAALALPKMDDAPSAVLSSRSRGLLIAGLGAASWVVIVGLTHLLRAI